MMQRCRLQHFNSPNPLIKTLAAGLSNRRPLKINKVILNPIKCEFDDELSEAGSGELENFHDDYTS